MTIHFNKTGAERKRLVTDISEITGMPAKYLGVPSCAYRVGDYTVDKDGALSFEESTDAERLIEALSEKGYEAEAEDNILEIQMPLSTIGNGLNNLTRMLEAKGKLIQKAIGKNTSLPLRTEDDRLCFPWFPGDASTDEVKAYTHLVTALCNLAKRSQRTTVTEKDITNEKYAFRCFLLRLGFIGDEYKEERKVLLRNFTGSGAFRNGAKRTEGGEA